MGKIKITTGGSGGSSIAEKHLITNHLKDPSKNIDTLIQYAEKRPLMTFLTAGITEGRYTAPQMIGKDTAKTRIKQIPEGELLDDIAWRYKIMGRIQKAVEIVNTNPENATIGTSNSGGYFQLILKDQINPGLNVIFYNGRMARVMNMPTGSTGNYTHTFQCYPGVTFDYATWITPQIGTKTCFAGFSTYGERSLRGYGNVFYPDEYIQHMTIQRKGLNISGDANTQAVLWYEYNGEKGAVYEAEAQVRAQFLLEDEFQKWWGLSNMKDELGNLLPASGMTDDETGEPICSGDGAIEQIKGANDSEASGTDGLATYDDFRDLLTTIKKKSNYYMGMRYYAVTGTEGYDKAAAICAAQGTNLTHIITQTTTPGGADVPVGFNFNTLNIGGNQIVFVENPMMNDTTKFPRPLSTGKSYMGNTYYFLDQSELEGGKTNMEIRARGRGHINRNFVYFIENGMTGDGVAQSSIDAKKIEMFKQNMMIVYNTKSCGILLPSSTV